VRYPVLMVKITKAVRINERHVAFSLWDERALVRILVRYIFN
jgi:hypothetical protein